MTPADAKTDYDVAVIGLGPVGSTLVALLAQRGLRVLAVEQDRNVFALPRAAHIDHMGLRTLQEIGVLDELLPGMIPNPGLDFRSAAGMTLMRIPGDQRSVSGLPASMYFHQPTLDRALRDRALGLPGVDSRMPARLVSFQQDDTGVTLLLRSNDGSESVERADWIVGCDGAWSPVREGSGLTLESLGFDERWLVVDLRLPYPIPGLPEHAVHMCDPARPHTAIPMPNLHYRFELQLRDDEDGDFMQQPAQVANLLARWLDIDQVQVERAATYTFHGLVAPRWRAGRALIAGDAAHQMPPFLGQGMCSGLRDAVNLAWKLAWVVKRDLPPASADALLDTYGAERQPHVRAITEAVISFGEVICTRDEAVAATRDARLGLDTRPLEKRIPFSLPPLTAGPLVEFGGGRLFGQPERTLGEAGLDQVIGDRFLVVAADGAGGAESGGWHDQLDWWRDQLGALVLVPTTQSTVDRFLRASLERYRASVLVIRPDRYVHYAGDDLAVARAALSPILTTAEVQVG